MTVQNALDRAFTAAHSEDRAALILYMTAGFPDREVFVELACAVLDAGADALEIGIPFSDPLLDGAAIQRSQEIALEGGVTPADCLRFASLVREQCDKPLLFMGAYNPILTHRVEKFCWDAYRAGVTGLVVPDVPYEEQAELREAAAGADIHLIQLLAPTSTQDRVRALCSVATGFVYCISVAGVTGVRAGVPAAARPLVERARSCTDLPVAVGFGIAGPGPARQVADFADGIIVGSALINLLANAAPQKRITLARAFVASLRDAVERSAAAVSGECTSERRLEEHST